MRLSLELLLYAGALGVLGQTGSWIYQATDRLGAPAGSELTRQGQDTATDRVAAGKGQRPGKVSWAYDQPEWWPLFRTANFVGRLPPKPTDSDAAAEDQRKVLAVRPLEEIIELVTLMCDGDGKRTHVVVRYKTADVKPPEDVLRQMQAAMPIVPAHDVAPRGGKSQAGLLGNKQSTIGSAVVRPTTGLPISHAAREYVQEVTVGESLWEPYSDVTLVAVSPDAETATFRRRVPGCKPGDPAVERVDHLAKNFIEHRDVAAEFLWVRTGWQTTGHPASKIKWVDTEETVKVDDVWHIGTKDSKHYQDDRDALLEGVHLEAYRSSIGSGLSGVSVANIEPNLSQRYGVQPGDVLLDINGEKVHGRADALQVGHQQYNRGVRTFDAHFLANGQVITRTYQLPRN
jgi:hypothetical protein